MAKRWLFVEHWEDRPASPARWSWRLLGVDDAIDKQSSEEFDSFGKVVINAIVSGGFEPRQDEWIVVGKHEAVHHRYGRPGVIVRKEDFSHLTPLLRPFKRRSEKKELRSTVKKPSESEER